jgi:hypothetical protein
MHGNRITVLVSFLLTPVIMAYAQLSGFASASYGYHSNPLYNHEEISDQLRQGYLEVQYGHDSPSTQYRLGYIGGLMLFNQLTERNYYEHILRGGFALALGSLPPKARLQGPDAENNDHEDDGGEQADTDSLLSYLEVGVRAGARHDKDAYQEFDNVGAAVTAGYRFPIEGLYVRLQNDAGYRGYTYVTELSNITDVLTLQIGRFAPGVPTYGVQMYGGVKHFIEGVFDTTRFEATRTYVEKDPGKGKGGAKLVAPSSKQILIEPTNNTSGQFGAHLFALFPWNEGSFGVDLLWRFNVGEGTRYLAQYANTSILTEDVYNDYFSYDGPAARLVLRQRLPLNLQSIMSVEVTRKVFSAPALDLNGNQTASHRVDLHTALELYLSRYIELGMGFGLDVAFSAAAGRNQSNDEYNDYTLTSVALSVGAGW